MNGNLFRPLTKLTDVYLILNICINEDFDTQTRIAVLQQTVSEKCQFETTTVQLETEFNETSAQETFNSLENNSFNLTDEYLEHFITFFKAKLLMKVNENASEIDESGEFENVKNEI